MRSSIRIILTFALTGSVAAAMAWLPQLDKGRTRGELAVFRTNQLPALNEQNLVDQLGGLPLRLDIGHVQWSHSVLQVDLLSYGTPRESDIYRDLYELTRFGLLRTSNVSQVTVRVLDQTGGGSRNGPLLMAMDARREDTGDGRAAELKPDRPDLAEQLRKLYRISYTSRWKDKTGEPR
ncbi:hypothetical protein N6H14_30560 [Paenibacillus sp. CC-CFT747]|nr:hypothetical protein N6H14_30560 [Paenibacillus sp. CC-CFT747]